MSDQKVSFRHVFGEVSSSDKNIPVSGQEEVTTSESGEEEDVKTENNDVQKTL